VQVASLESRNGTEQAARSSDAPTSIISKPEEEKAASIPKGVEPLSAPVEMQLIEPDEEPENEEVELPDWDGVSIQDDEDLEEEAVSQEVVPVDVEIKTEEEVQIAPVGVDGEDAVAALPTLTVGEVKDKWEYVIRRVRTKKGGDGAKVSAFLKGFTVEGIEGTSDLPVVVIKAIAEFHYKALQKDEYSEMILWAMKIELGIDCKLRMLSPSASTSNRSAGGSTVTASNMLAALPSRSAHLERPRTVPSPEKSKPTPQQQANPANKEPVQRFDQASPASPVSPVPISEAQATPPLARISVVRENTSNGTSEKTKTVETGETRQHRIEQHAKSDPVVQEVMRVFKAEIKSIQPK
nr:hypothetical protein [Ktedonobacteraceae bacterium]